MSQNDSVHAWWSRLRHQGLLLSPVVLLDENRPYHSAPTRPPFPVAERLRNAHTRFQAKVGDGGGGGGEVEPSAILAWADALLGQFIGLEGLAIARGNHVPTKYNASVRIGSGSQTLRPDRVIFADPGGNIPALFVMADTSRQLGRGRGRTAYARFLELLRGTGHRLGLMTNGLQFRLVYAGLDFESWAEWETDRWFDDGEGTEELLALRQLLSPESLKPDKEGRSGLLAAVEESRKRQADLSSVLRENVRQAVEFLLEDVSKTSQHEPALFHLLVNDGRWTVRRRGLGRTRMPVQDYRDLEVWQQAMDLVTQVYQLTAPFPKEETYGLKNQIRRAAVSVPSNIAEGQGRRTTKDFLNHLSIARGSLLEVQTQIEISERLGYLTQTRGDQVNARITTVVRLLNGLIRALERKLT